MIALLVALAGAPAFADGPPRVPVLHQGRLPGCVTFSAAAIARFLGVDVTGEALHRSVPVTANGVAYDDVARALVALGLSAEVLHADVSGMRALLVSGPVVVGQARPRQDHALVVEAYDPDRDRYAVMDPAHPGRRFHDAPTLDRAFLEAGGTLLVIRRAPDYSMAR